MRVKKAITNLIVINGLVFSLPHCGEHAEKMNGFNQPVEISSRETNFLLKRYQNCDALESDLNEKLTVEQRYQYSENRVESMKNQSMPSAAAKSVNTDNVASSAGAASANGVSNSPVSDAITTNLQEVGVDEADEIKMDAQNIYVLNNQVARGRTSIAIAQQDPLKLLGKLDIEDLTAAKMFTIDNGLIVMGQTSSSKTKILNYKVTPGRIPKLTKKRTFNGSLLDSRASNGKIILVSQENLVKKNAFSSHANRAFDLRDSTFQGWNCTDIYRSNNPAAIPDRFLTVLSVDFKNLEVLSESVFPSEADQIYMTEANLYISAHIRLPQISQVNADPTTLKQLNDLQAEADDTLVITKLSFDQDSGKIAAVAQGNVTGHLKQFDSAWAFKEISFENNMYLSVATTTGDVRSTTKDDIAKNHLFVLSQEKDDLKVVGEIRDFGVTEDIRAVRYIGNMAYIVTFQRTDPLFAIDLSNPKHPEILGELHIPGFSMYMHPMDSDRLIGVGFDTEVGNLENQSFYQGLLVQLFDIKKPDALERLDHTVLGRRGSYSEANLDHHAFYFDPKDAIIGYPVVLFDDAVREQPVNNGQAVHTTRQFSGAVFYHINDDHLEEVKRDSHFEFLPPTCQSNLQPRLWNLPLTAPAEIRRIFKNKGNIITVSNFGIKMFDSGNWSEKGKLQIDFPDCAPIFGGGGFE